MKRIVLASSVAAVGCLSPGFRPRRLPVDDEHPCDAVDAYGLSKYLGEEVARYFCRLDPTLEITAFRIRSPWPTVATLEAVLGEEAARYDLSWYADDGRAHAGLWATDRLSALDASQGD